MNWISMYWRNVDEILPEQRQCPTNVIVYRNDWGVSCDSFWRGKFDLDEVCEDCGESMLQCDCYTPRDLEPHLHRG